MDIESWIYRTLDDAHASSSGHDVIVNCPFCESRVGKVEPSHHLSISLVKQVCHCYRCEYSASWAQLVMDVEQCSYREAMDAIEADGLTPLYKLLPQSRSRPRPELRDMPDWFMTIDQASKMHLATNFSRQMVHHAAMYLRKRLDGYMDDWTVYTRRWGIDFRPQGFGKLIIPVERGWWQSRNIWRKQYMSPTYPIEDRLYNYSALDRLDPVAICEGAISAACYGEDAVALCGKVANVQQLMRLIRAKVTHYIVCIESGTGDDMRDLASQLRRYRKQVTLKLYDGDPASTQEYKEMPYTAWTDVVRERWT